MTAPQSFPDRIQRAFRQAIAEKVFPGAVMLVQNGDKYRWHAAWGVADLTTGAAVHRQTFFDLASLTKPLCTSLAILQLAQAGRLRLEDRLGDVVPAFEASGKAAIRIRQLLSHRSGLPAWRPYFESLRQKPFEARGDGLIQRLVHEPLLYAPGTDAVYSDLDFMVLQIVAETLGRQSLDHLVVERLYRPLGISELFFTDTRKTPPHRPFAATENCPWRGRILKGHVHDDNAYVLGGVAGHAGLFGTAAGVADLLSALLSALNHAEHATVLNPVLLRHFFQRQNGTDWALGFDTPATRGSSSGHSFSSHSVGHLGFTGTSFWMDLEREFIVVLLTNRVHPSRANAHIKSFRPRIHDMVMEELGRG